MTLYYKKAKKLLKQKPKNINVKAPSNISYNHTINEKVYKADYMDMLKRFVDYCEKHKQYPNYVTTKQSKTPSSYKLFAYCIDKIVRFIDKNGYYPNYCTFNYKDIQSKTSSTKKSNNCTNPYVSSPHYTSNGCNKLGQCTPYYCGPHSIHQCLRKFGITKYSEKQLASWTGTTTNGSDHNGINTCIAKVAKESGVKLKTEWKNFSDLGKDTNSRFSALAKLLCKPNIAVLTHIGYQGSGESATGALFGHYECLDYINLTTKKVRALNSLGVKKSDGSYPGHLQYRSFQLQATYFRNTPKGQKAICIITKG